MSEYKACTKCGVEKLPDDFNDRKQVKSGKSRMCKVCKAAYDKEYVKTHSKYNKEYQKKYREEHRDKNLAYHVVYWEIHKDKYNARRRERFLEDPSLARRNSLKSCFGITIEEYERLFKNQNGVCAICGKEETHKHQNGKVVNLAVDHDHKTGVVRGLLCRTCNHGVGNFMDNPILIRKAAKYIEASE